MEIRIGQKGQPCAFVQSSKTWYSLSDNSRVVPTPHAVPPTAIMDALLRTDMQAALKRAVPTFMGADPELFICNHDEERVLPAWEVVALPGAFTRDAAAFELHPAPSFCLELLAYNLYCELSTLLPQYKVSEAASWAYSLKEAPHPSGRVGCKPSCYVYKNPPTIPPYPRMFAAGGHIHIERNTSPTGESCVEHEEQTVRWLDRLCGLPSVCLSQQWDVPERRLTFGLAGEYRRPSASRLEYRTPSSQWLTSPLAFHTTFMLARAAFQLGQIDGFDPCALWDGNDGEVRAAIDASDALRARELCLRPRNARILSALLGKPSEDFVLTRANLKELLSTGWYAPQVTAAYQLKKDWKENWLVRQGWFSNKNPYLRPKSVVGKE